MFWPHYVQDWAAVHNLCPDLPHLSQTKLLLENTSLLCKLDQFHIFLWQMSQFYHKINTLKPNFSWQVTLFDLLNAFLTEQLLSISSSTAKSSLTLGIDTIQDFLIKLGIKPRMHLWEISIFQSVIVRPTKIMNRADKNWAHF